MVENNELSRRSFLKRSGALTLGSVAAGSALLTGCDNPNTTSSTQKRRPQKHLMCQNG